MTRSSTRRVAAIDCGTNSLRLLLADVDPGRAELTDLTRRMEIVRLGQGVDSTGRLAPEALARTIAVLRDYADVIASSGAQAVRMATVARAPGAPVRVQLVDVLRKHAGKVCVRELVPLFDLSQPTVSHHLKVLREAGIVGSERVGLWA